MRALLFAAAVAAALPGTILTGTILPCEAATLRPMSVLNRPTVRLSDLFDDAGANATRVLGPAPAVGARLVVEAAQLAAIARQFGVAWRPASLADRVVLDRPGRPLPRDEVTGVVQAALIRAGAPEDAEMELPGFDAPLVPAEGTVQPLVTQVDYDPTSGRFAALLSIAADTMDPISLRVAGRLVATMEVAVPAGRLQSGTVLRPQDLHLARVRAGLVRGEVIHDPAEVAGMALRHPAAAGQPILRADLVRPPVVEKGSTVMMQLETQGISLSGQGQALDSGAKGEHVRVLNPVSRAVLDAEVTGPGRVRVEPDTIPIVPPGRAAMAALR